MMGKSNKTGRAGCLFLFLLGVILLFRARYGFQQSDESYYLAMVDRIWKGDGLLLDEWNLAQWYVPILYPFYWLYRSFVGVQGVYLFFRVLMLLFAGVVSMGVYDLLKNHYQLGEISSAVSASLVLLYSKSNIYGASYTTLSIYLMILAIVLLQKQKWFAAGAVSALMVLCMPYLAIGVIGLILYYFRKKRVGYGCGAAFAAVVYLMFFIRWNRWKEICQNLPYIFQDPEHEKNFFRQLYHTMKSLWNYIGLFNFMVFFLCLVLVWCYWRGWRKPLLKGGIFGLCLGMMAIQIVLKGATDPGYYALFMVLFSIPVTLLRVLDRTWRKEEMWFWAAGLFLAVCTGGASNTRVNGVCGGLVVVSIGSAVSIAVCAKDFDRKYGKAAADVFLSALCLFLLVLRIFIVARDAELITLTEKIEVGPAAGLYTTKEHLETYGQVLEILDDLRKTYPEGKIFYTKLLPWAYLYTDYEVGAPTVWRTGMDSERLEEYYLLHPDKFPDIVVRFADQVGSYKANRISGKKADPDPNANTEEGYLYNRMMENGYEVYKLNVADVYIRTDMVQR